ncbi:MAG TPA: lipid IV(A) 3-deoxy-D-manno-octulosonic acid transferase [Burkholderiaceae bacterium]|nr:lipid IV(A) 3-deoxy-D-manno-octulosonic acid transferase [Burkholderiaceae bacterium]
MPTPATRRAAALPRRARLAYALYSTAWRIGWPLAMLHLALRSWRQPAYRAHWSERFLGRSAARFPTPALRGTSVFWIHAVSLGETRAAAPLIERLAALDPEARFVLTHMTPTGRDAGAEIAARLPGRVLQRYLPYDLPGAVDRFFREARASVGVLLETETWPNLLAGARRARVPVVLVNARLSARSLERSRRWPTLIRAATSQLARVVAQTTADAQRIRQLYAGPVDVVGNLKFDLDPAPQQLERGRAWRAQAAPRAVWVFANTRDGEEELLLDAFDAWIAAGPRDVPAGAVQLVVVPRHPQRFDDVARIIAKRGHVVVRRSDAAAFERPRAPGEIVLGDTMGEMAAYYASADVAFVGGSLAPLGGHNLIEACACGCAVVVGRHTFNFAQATQDALASGAAVAVDDAAGVVATMAALSADRERLAAMRSRALDFAAAHRGATARTAAIVRDVARESAGAAP